MRKITLQRERENTFFVEYKLNGGIVTYNGNTQQIKKVQSIRWMKMEKL